MGTVQYKNGYRCSEKNHLTEQISGNADKLFLLKTQTNVKPSYTALPQHYHKQINQHQTMKSILWFVWMQCQLKTKITSAFNNLFIQNLQIAITWDQSSFCILYNKRHMRTKIITTCSSKSQSVMAWQQPWENESDQMTICIRTKPLTGWTSHNAFFGTQGCKSAGLSVDSVHSQRPWHSTTSNGTRHPPRMRQDEAAAAAVHFLQRLKQCPPWLALACNNPCQTPQFQHHGTQTKV